MSNISDLIERYLKKLIAGSSNGFIEIQRSDLAERFNCVPSQINYVLSTRFTVNSGFVIESRRGGGGYIRIIRLPLNGKNNLLLNMCQLIGKAISQQSAKEIVIRLNEEGLITEREARVMKAALSRNVLKVELPLRDQVRASILKSMLIALLG